MTIKIHKVTSSITYEAIPFTTSDQWSIVSEMDITHVLKDNLVIDEAVEFTDAFELDSGGVDITLKYDSTVWDYLYDSFDLTEGNILSITENNAIFWGGIEKGSIGRDLVADEITFSATNMYRFLINTLGHRVVKEPLSSTSDLKEYLIEYFDGDLVDDIVMEIGDVNLELDTDYLTTLSSNGMTLKAFMMEVQKQFGCFFYITPDKYLHVTNRGHSGSVPKNIDNLIEDDYEIYLNLTEYNSVLCNSVTENWSEFGGVPTDVPAHDWVLIHKLNGTREAVFLYGDLDNIDGKFNYLDMRQQLYWDGTSFVKSTAWKLFSFVEGGTFDTYDFDYLDTWNLYENVVNDQEVVECSYYGTDLDLFDKVAVGDNDYQVFGLTKDYKANRSKIIAKRLL